MTDQDRRDVGNDLMDMILEHEKLARAYEAEARIIAGRYHRERAEKLQRAVDLIEGNVRHTGLVRCATDRVATKCW